MTNGLSGITRDAHWGLRPVTNCGSAEDVQALLSQASDQ